MTSLPTGPTTRSAARPEEILVALPHVGRVSRMLDAVGASHQVADESVALGLARVVLADVRSAAQALAREAEDQRAVLRLRAGDGPLEEVLSALRGLSAREHAGWAPTMGKNRIVGRVVGTGEVQHGGGGLPIGILDESFAPRASGAGRGARVGVLDTAISPEPWLAGGWLGAYDDMLAADGERTWVDGHATFVAGLVLGQAPSAVVEVRRLLDADGSADSWETAKAIADFGRSGMDVLNLSFGCSTEDGEAPLALAAAIDRLDPDIVVVAAAGNHGDEEGDAGRRPLWPAALDDVVAVGAADGSTTAPFSPPAPWVDLRAPGVGVVSTYLTGRVRLPDSEEEFTGLAAWSGTSFAAAVVSGAVAARIEPGRRSARDAFAELYATARAGEGDDPPLLDLDVTRAPRSE